jgi:predicted CoA-binding protein
MTTKAEIEEFFAQKNLALAGVSRSGNKFGNSALAELKMKGFRVFVIHPEAREIAGEPCYAGLADLPEPVGGLALVVPPAETVKLVKEAHSAGIRRVWMQPGAECASAVQFCKDHDMTAITGECIMMYPRANGFHNFHRIVRTVFGQMPR